MAYTDGLQLYVTQDTQVETAAAIMDWDDRVGEASTAALQAVRCPNGATIEEWGVLVTEAITNANATKCVLTLQVAALEGASVAAAATMTLPGQASDITTANLVGGATAAQALAVGARHIASGGPVEVAPGGHFYLEVTTAAGAAGGAVRGWACVRHGAGMQTSASPVYKIAS